MFNDLKYMGGMTPEWDRVWELYKWGGGENEWNSICRVIKNVNVLGAETRGRRNEMGALFSERILLMGT